MTQKQIEAMVAAAVAQALAEAKAVKPVKKAKASIKKEDKKVATKETKNTKNTKTSKEIENACEILKVKEKFESLGIKPSREQLKQFKAAEEILSIKKASAPKKGKGKEEKEEKEVDINKFEPKTGADGQYRWDSYKACRSAYCYTMQGCKVWKGKVTKPDGWTFNEKQWEKDKAFFGKTFVYVKKADR